jgi:hypothetical protein
MVVLTGRAEDGDRTGGCDLQVWEMAPPNHASLGIHLGQPVADMLAVFEPSATSWSKRLNNQWDTAGIKDTSGYGTVTSHYCTWWPGTSQSRFLGSKRICPKGL